MPFPWSTPVVWKSSFSRSICSVKLCFEIYMGAWEDFGLEDFSHIAQNRYFRTIKILLWPVFWSSQIFKFSTESVFYENIFLDCFFSFVCFDSSVIPWTEVYPQTEMVSLPWVRSSVENASVVLLWSSCLTFSQFLFLELYIWKGVFVILRAVLLRERNNMLHRRHIVFPRVLFESFWMLCLFMLCSSFCLLTVDYLMSSWMVLGSVILVCYILCSFDSFCIPSSCLSALIVLMAESVNKLSGPPIPQSLWRHVSVSNMAANANAVIGNMWESFIRYHISDCVNTAGKRQDRWTKQSWQTPLMKLVQR